MMTSAKSARVGRIDGQLLRRAGAMTIVALLLILALANLAARASYHEVEDGVLWTAGPEGVVVQRVSPPGPGAKAGLEPGDILLAIDGQPVQSIESVLVALHGAHEGQALVYTVLRAGEPALREVVLEPVPRGQQALYFILASVAIFALVVGLIVRLRRPRDQASLHFFWLSVAFFGVLAFSFSGRLDRLDWIFYWSDVVALLLLPPLFVHFALVFPDRPDAWVRSTVGRAALPLLYFPALLLGGARVAVLVRPATGTALTGGLLSTIDRLELVYLGVGLVGGLAVMLAALGSVRSVTARRQLRWIVWGTALGGLPFVAGYLVPFVLGFTPWSQIELFAIPLALIPLAFASAVVRYRLMDVEVIIKRTMVYTAAVSAIVAIYALLLKLAGEALVEESSGNRTIIAVLATLVVVLLAPLVKNAIQTTLDRAYYRDRYDYRRALVAFARDLNSDLDLERLSLRLVDRVMETLLVDRMALLVAPLEDPVGGGLHAVRAEGFEAAGVPSLQPESGVGGRVCSGHTVNLDDPLVARRFTSDEVAFWRERGVSYFVPCMAKDTPVAIMALGPRQSGEPLSSEDVALLTAVAGQVATAIENARLYHQLRRKATELDRLREFSDNIIASLRDGLFVVGLDERVVRWNPALEVMYGVSRSAAIGRPVGELFDEAFLARLRAARSEDRNEIELYRVPLTSRHGDGARQLLVNAGTAFLCTSDGTVTGTLVIIEDITARVHLEEQLQISEKMASIGLLAAGVAHEVNTPLTGISSFTQMLLDGADPDAAETKLLEKIERQTFRAAKIVNGLLNLARPAHAESGPIDLHVAVGDVLSLLEHQLRKGHVQVRRELQAPSAFIFGVEHKLQQVFLNARDAMPTGGWLSIRTGAVNGRITVEVGDTGSGIPREQISRIYDPFFTTKPIGQGTGLGLSITYGIVSEFGGTITCDSRPGQGTRFVLAFPAAPAMSGTSTKQGQS